MSATIDIRPLQAGDEAEWRQLWMAYLAFYETTVCEEVYATTFSRMLTKRDIRPILPSGGEGRPTGGPRAFPCRTATDGGRKTSSICRISSPIQPRAAKASGRKLIEAVYAAADAAGTPSVYWMTQEFNYAGRMLYDRIGTKSRRSSSISGNALEPHVFSQFGKRTRWRCAGSVSGQPVRRLMLSRYGHRRPARP